VPRIVRKPDLRTGNTESEASGAGIIGLVRDLCTFRTGVVADENELLFARLGRELPFRLLRWRSGDTFNGWVVPENWRVEKAEIRRSGTVVFNGTGETLAVAQYARSFQGVLEWDALKRHLVTNSDLPDAYVYHCIWQYRPWAADWALSIPFKTYREWGPGQYEVNLRTSCEPGEMIVGEHQKTGRSEATIVFQSHNCHPRMANDGFAGAAILIRLFQWLSGQDTHYTYRLVIAPEHVGTVFYLRDMPRTELDRIVCGAFVEMPGTPAPIKIASSFLGNQPIDYAFCDAVRFHAAAHVLVPWRQGAGNDETVWEAPGYEVSFVEATRSEDFLHPFREYHTSLDTADLMQPRQLDEMLNVLKRVVETIEGNCRIFRRFDGLVCLSNPIYDLYQERLDPAIDKDLPEDAEQWGQLLDSLLRYFDGSMTILDIARRHDMPFSRVNAYIRRFAEKGLIDLEFAPIRRLPPKRFEDRSG
jgi:aminopeptidase-like protein